MNELQNTKGIKRSKPDHQGHSSKKSKRKNGSGKLLPRRIERLLKWKEKHNKLVKNNLNLKPYVDKEVLNNLPALTVSDVTVTHTICGDAFTATECKDCHDKEKVKDDKEKVNHDKVVALDCEMVGTGTRGRVNALARCSIVDYHGNVVYDKYVKPSNPVTDYRTRWSGIREGDLTDASCFNQVQTEVQEILTGKIIVGHSLHHDFAVLKLEHPKSCLRDTAEYKLLKELTNIGESSWTPSLRYLVRCLLLMDIQVGEHCSAADARAALNLYKLVENQWEEELKQEKRITDGTAVSYMDDEFWPSEIFL